MRKRAKHMIRASLFALPLLTGVLGCVRRTGALYCDTLVSLSGPVILVRGTSMWGSGVKRDSFSTTVGSILTLKALLFSWWWDTLCIPYDIYLKFDGVDFYVYDQDGLPIPDVTIKTYGEASLYGMEKKTDAKGHLYYPRSVQGFKSLSAKKEGYWGDDYNSTVWLSQCANADLPQMLKPEYRNGAVIIPTTNNMHTLNIYMKRAPQTLPVADSYHLVVSNAIAGVEYGVDLSAAELCAPFGTGKSADVKVRLSDDEITSHQRVRSSLAIETGCSDVLFMGGDGCVRWPYLYYVPPSGSFGKGVESGNMKMPALMKLPDSTNRYAIVAGSGINQFRQQGTPACIYLRYWNVDVPDNGVLVCDYWSRKVNKVLVPITEDSIREAKEKMAEEARIRALKEAEQKKRAEQKRKSQEHLKRYKELDPYVEALFSNADDFHKALEHSDDPLLRHRWTFAIHSDVYSRKVRKEYLREILKKLEAKPDKEGEKLKRIILREIAK